MTNDHLLLVSRYFISSLWRYKYLCFCTPVMSMLWSIAEAVCSGSWPILFKVLASNVDICIVLLSNFCVCWNSIAEISNTGARVPISARGAPFLPARKSMQFWHVVWVWIMVIFRWLCFIVLHTEYMCYNQTGNIATLDGASLKLVDKFTYLGSSVSSTEKDIDTRLTKAWTAIDRLSIIWKSDLTDKMKRSFFQAAVVSILLYGCTTWTLTKRLERRLDGNYTRMLRAVLNKSWRQHPTRLQLYGHLPPITKTIQVRRTRHAGHCWRSKDELISDVLLWTPTHGCASVGRPARTYIQQLCEDTGCNPEDLPEAMSDREKWRETVRDIRADGATWWWWYHPNIWIAVVPGLNYYILALDL